MSCVRASGVLGFVFSGFFLLSSQAQGPSPYAFAGEPFSATAADLGSVSAAMPVDQRYAAQIFFEEGIYRISSAGTLTYTHRMIYRVDTRDGVEDWSEVSSDWDPWYEKPSQLHARVLKSDGHFVELDQKTITDAPVKADDSETFSSGHVRRAPLPGVAIGSIVEEVETTEEKSPYFTGGSLYGFSFQDTVPLGRTRLIVETPVAIPFRDAVSGLPDVKVDRSEKDGVRRVVYEATGVPVRHRSDIDLATNTPREARVDFATGESWSKVASVYAALSDPKTIVEEARAILPEGLPSERAARIRSIVERLHREVRYTGVEFGEAQLTPQRPAEVIQRHYGDCKDKATLLVAMLRATGIDANLALLSTGPDRPLDPGLPGMNRFDHAIVYVPATATDKALWIDATAQYYEVGSLPYGDQGRSALVIAPGTTALTQTPAARPDDSTLVETRTYRLSEFGNSQVTEESQTHGYIDATYRQNYGGPDTPKMHEEMENYVKRICLAKTLKSMTHGSGTDLGTPFRLTLTADGARRGTTAMTEALVAIFPSGTTDALPKWFSTAPAVLDANSSAEAKQRDAESKESRASSYAIKPFRYEQRSRILIPAGFALRSLPAGKTTVMGPGSLTESYSADAESVTVVFRFDSGPSQMAAEQALALRDAMLELNKREYVGIYFDQVGAKALTAGRFREALEADRALISAHPESALQHVRLAYALLQAGIGDAAHDEARRATELDPKSAQAFSTLAWTLQHDDLGERFGKGYDRAGAISAYRKSIQLDPEEDDNRMNLAVLLEFDGRGIRYASDADMPAAIALYKELIERTKDKDVPAADRYRENLLYCLLYTRQFADLDKMLDTLPSGSAHTTLAITSAAAQRGVKAGVARADQGNVPASERNQDLRSAGAQLAQMHLYAEAADVLSAGMQGGESSSTLAREIEMYRGLTSSSMAPLPDTNPARPVQAVTVGALAGTLTRDEMTRALSREGYASEAAYNRDIEKTLATAGFLRLLAAKVNMTQPVLMDMVGGNIKYSSTGDDNNGYAVDCMVPGAGPDHMYVIRDGGAYRILAEENDDAAIGTAVLLALDKHSLSRAKAMLDWKRDLVHKQGGDDSFSGPLLPRFWTVGSSKEGADSPEAMRLAAISLLVNSPSVKRYLPEITSLREKASGQRQIDLDLLLGKGGMGAEDAQVTMTAGKHLLEDDPDSATALRIAVTAYLYQNDPAGLQAMLRPRLEKKPKDRDLLNSQARAYELARDFTSAQAVEQKVLDSGKAEASDYNMYAWLGLFDGHLTEDQIKAAQQSNMMSKNGSFADLHTLACVYAAQGRTTEARQVLREAMYAANQTEPNSEVWYSLGLIYEQYGEKASALKAYRRVKAQEGDGGTYIDPVSTYVLAQTRSATLDAK